MATTQQSHSPTAPRLLPTKARCRPASGAPQSVLAQPQMDMMNNFLPAALPQQYNPRAWNSIPQGPPPEEEVHPSGQRWSALHVTERDAVASLSERSRATQTNPDPEDRQPSQQQTLQFASYMPELQEAATGAVASVTKQAVEQDSPSTDVEELRQERRRLREDLLRNARALARVDVNAEHPSTAEVTNSQHGRQMGATTAANSRLAPDMPDAPSQSEARPLPGRPQANNDTDYFPRHSSHSQLSYEEAEALSQEEELYSEVESAVMNAGSTQAGEAQYSYESDIEAAQGTAMLQQGDADDRSRQGSGSQLRFSGLGLQRNSRRPEQQSNASDSDDYGAVETSSFGGGYDLQMSYGGDLSLCSFGGGYDKISELKPTMGGTLSPAEAVEVLLEKWTVVVQPGGL
ncbi:hypothetical protein LTR08_007928 [Meristemomyces frigidus]|nr:hypothetical protein LTR08_007928 [Meristemomyces frigidus]